MESFETPDRSKISNDEDYFVDAPNVHELTIFQVPKDHHAPIVARSPPVGATRSQKFYAVRRGYRPRLYLSWHDCKVEVDGFRGAEHKSFRTLAEAEDFLGLCSPSPH